MQTTDEPQFSPTMPVPEARANRGAAEDGRPEGHSAAHTAGPVPAHAHGSLPAPTRGAAEPRPREIGGRDGPEPTRFGDWEKAGRCIDF